jgi:hypothetical protein
MRECIQTREGGDDFLYKKSQQKGLVAIVISRKKQVCSKDKHFPFPYFFPVEANKREFWEKRRCLDEIGAQNKWVNHSVLKRREIDVLRRELQSFIELRARTLCLTSK